MELATPKPCLLWPWPSRARCLGGIRVLGVLTQQLVDEVRDLRVEWELSRNPLAPTEVSRVSR